MKAIVVLALFVAAAFASVKEVSLKEFAAIKSLNYTRLSQAKNLEEFRTLISGKGVAPAHADVVTSKGTSRQSLPEEERCTLLFPIAGNENTYITIPQVNQLECDVKAPEYYTVHLFAHPGPLKGVLVTYLEDEDGIGQKWDQVVRVHTGRYPGTAVEGTPSRGCQLCKGKSQFKFDLEPAEDACNGERFDSSTTEGEHRDRCVCVHRKPHDVVYFTTSDQKGECNAAFGRNRPVNNICNCRHSCHNDQSPCSAAVRTELVWSPWTSTINTASTSESNRK